jgi:phosphohistidine phosphatase
MHQLILLRHAKAAPERVGGSDHDRALTPAGVAAATIIGAAMRQAGLAPEVVLVSSAVRTQQSFDALERADVWEERPNMDSVPALYMAPATRIRDLLRDLPETVRSAMVIGHNPGLHELALQLAAFPSPKPELARLADGYPTSSLAEFMVATTWRKLGAGGAALQRFWLPGDF